VYNQIKVEEKIHDDEVAYMGDDTPDLLVMQQVGLPITVPNAIDAIKAIAVITTQHEGGRGAVREICDYLMTCQPTT
jgi:3-deoxy-D-manno-octulosonate 8-phosphate phosphatase (KDO 8-P phosphatase)